MRSPERIDEVLTKIKIIWKRFPDLRLMQLLLNVIPNGSLAYYIEDEELTKALLNFYLENINE